MDKEADDGLHYCKMKEHHHHLKLELNQGLEFDSPEAAYDFYNAYAEQSGFYIRVSRNEGSITCRRFVCSEQACEAFLMVRLNDSGKWVVASFFDEHNHPLVKTNVELDTHHLRRCIGNYWYPTLHSYFRVRQAEDSGFYYAFQVDESGRTGCVFWADRRSKFLYSQFGHSIVFDTSYRSMRNKDLARFASFVGVNHHKKPVLLGCALILDDECEECFTWVFRTWIKAMGGQPPGWIIADQDEAIRSSIARVFRKTRHRFSTWQIKEEEQRLFLTMDDDDGMFKHEYKYCVSHIHSKSVFESEWSLLLDKYNLNDNLWLNEMYRTRKSWALPYIRIPNFAGIPKDDEGNATTFFGDTTFVTQNLPVIEFLTRYIKVIQQHRDRENEDDFMPINSQHQLVNTHPIYPIENQCRQLYTNAIFVDFQKEISKCFEYICKELDKEGQYDQYLVFKLGENNRMYDKHGVFKIDDQRFNCTCFMFELKGLICTHILKVFEILNIHQISSRYILHRWTNNAKTCCVRDVDSVQGMHVHFKDLMLQSLQEEARDYCEAGASTFEKYKIALKILREGKSQLSNQS